MEKRIKIVVCMLALLLMPLISAVDVGITIKTGPNSDIALNVLNPDTLDAVQTLTLNSSETGIASATVSTGLSKIAISAIIRKNGRIIKVVKSSDYGNFSTSSPITIDTLAASAPVVTPVVPVVNVTNTTSSSVNTTANSSVNTTNSSIVNTTTTIPSTALSGSSTLTNVSANQSSFFAGIKDFVYKINYWAILKVVIYIIIGIVVLIVIFLAIRWVKARRNFTFGGQDRAVQPVATVKYSEREISEAEKRIKQAQEEIKYAQEQINKIKNSKNEVRIAEEKFLQAKRNLERLKGGKI